MRVETTDYLVAGSGIAGLRAAIALAEAGSRVVVLAKDAPIDSNTWEAQGGIAVVLSEEDRVGLHYQDTLEAGDGLCASHPSPAMTRDSRCTCAGRGPWATSLTCSTVTTRWWPGWPPTA